MDFSAIATLTAVLGRTPTEKELERYNVIFDKYNLKLKELYADYVNALYTGVSQDGTVAVRVDYRFSVKEINASQKIDQNSLLLEIQNATNNTLDESSKAYKSYLTKSQLLSGQLTDEIVREFSTGSSIDTNIDSKTLN